MPNVIIEHFNKEFSEVTLLSGSFAFSEEKCVKQILSSSGF